MENATVPIMTGDLPLLFPFVYSISRTIWSIRSFNRWLFTCRVEQLTKWRNVLSTHSLIVLLVADGIWYSDNIGFSMISDSHKVRIVDYLTSIERW